MPSLASSALFFFAVFDFMDSPMENGIAFLMESVDTINSGLLLGNEIQGNIHHSGSSECC